MPPADLVMLTSDRKINLKSALALLYLQNLRIFKSALMIVLKDSLSINWEFAPPRYRATTLPKTENNHSNLQSYPIYIISELTF